MARLETKTTKGLDGKAIEDVTITVPTRLDSQEGCTCKVGQHPNWVQPIPVGKVTYEPGKTYTVAPDVAKELQSKLNLAEKEPWEFVNVPTVDIYGYKFASGSLRINKDYFSTGEAHKVPGNLVPELQRIIAGRKAHDLTLMSRDINIKALQELAGSDSLTRAAAGGNMPVVASPEQLAALAAQLH